MGHYCKICGYSKPNEKFTGKGHKNHVCKECSQKPKEEIEEITLTCEIFNFLTQSNISKKNIKRLSELVNSKNAIIAKNASIVLEVAKIKPYKKKRLKFLASKNRKLLGELEETGLIDAHHL